MTNADVDRQLAEVHAMIDNLQGLVDQRLYEAEQDDAGADITPG